MDVQFDEEETMPRTARKPETSPGMARLLVRTKFAKDAKEAERMLGIGALVLFFLAGLFWMLTGAGKEIAPPEALPEPVTNAGKSMYG